MLQQNEIQDEFHSLSRNDHVFRATNQEGQHLCDGGKNQKKTVVMGRTKSDAKKGKREKIKLIQLHMPIKNNA